MFGFFYYFTQIVENLKMKLKQLQIPYSNSSSNRNYNRQSSKGEIENGIPCIIFLTKQFERIFVR